MASDEIYEIELRNGFYRDSIGKVLLLLGGVCTAIGVLAAMSIYLYLDKPPPITFPVDEDMRVQSAVPLDQQYLSSPDMLQWVADVLPKAFNLGFQNYNDQLTANSQNFTPDGWKTFLNQLNIYANYNNVQAYKLFVYGTPATAPFIVRQGVLEESGRYGWWVQMPINISYAGLKPPQMKTLTLQVLVVRVSTLNNLMGVAIDNAVVAPPPTTDSGT